MGNAFELTGGALCLDFTNTTDYRNAPDGRQEKLRTYDDLLAWSRQTGIVSASAAGTLAKRAAQEPARARALLERARELRETLFRLFAGEGSAEDMGILNRELARMAPSVGLVQEKQRYDWRWTGETDALESPLWPVLRSAVELLTTDTRKRVRMCAARSCGWLFIDTSKNHSRRWCDMQVCGNRAKARRFYTRHRKV